MASETVVSDGQGNVLTTVASTTADLHALGPNALALDQQVHPGDGDYTILPTDRYVNTDVVLTGTWTWRLPAASSVSVGWQVTVADSFGACNLTTYLTVPPAGTDTINLLASALIVEIAYGYVKVRSDGVANWTVVDQFPPPVFEAAWIDGTLSIAQGGTGQTAKTEAFDALSPMTTLGDLIRGGTSGTGMRLTHGSGTTGGALCGGDTTPYWSWPQGMGDHYAGVSGTYASTYDRSVFVSAAGGTPTSGTLNLTRIFVPRGTYTSITFYSVGAGATMTNQWFGLFTSAGAIRSLTVDDLTTAWAANSAKTLTFAGGSWTESTGGWMYVGCMVKGTTIPTQLSVIGLETVLRGYVPKSAMNSTTALTTPASCPDPVTLGATRVSMPYAELVYP